MTHPSNQFDVNAPIEGKVGGVPFSVKPGETATVTTPLGVVDVTGDVTPTRRGITATVRGRIDGPDPAVVEAMQNLADVMRVPANGQWYRLGFAIKRAPHAEHLADASVVDQGADDLPGWWDREANRGIVGLGPGGDDDERGWWPTQGYDGPLHRGDFGEGETTRVFAFSGRTREEWLALADAMLARWAAWRAHLAALPDAEVKT